MEGSFCASQANQSKDADITRLLQDELDTLENQKLELTQAVAERRKNVGGVISESGWIGIDAERQSYFDNLSKAMADKSSGEAELQQLEVQLQQIADLIEKNKQKPNEPIYEFGIENSVASDPSVSIQTNQLAEQEVRITQNSNYREDSPYYKASVKTRDSVAAGLENAKHNARAKALLSLEGQTKLKHEAAKKNVDDAGTRIAKFDQELGKHAADTIEYGKAMSELKEKEGELEAARNTWRDVKDKIRIARADSRAPASIDIAVQPQAPSDPDSKRRLKFMVLVAMMACAAGFAFGLYRELTDQNVGPYST